MTYEINTFFVNPSPEILVADQDVETIDRQMLFVSINDEVEMSSFVHRSKIMKEKVYTLVTIKKGDKFLIGHKAWGIDVWTSYIKAAFYYLLENKSREMFGVEPIVLEMKPLTEDKIQVILKEEEIIGNKIIYSFEVKEREFLIDLLQAAELYVSKMIEYGFTIKKDSIMFYINKCNSQLYE